jgi:hypothetical protein
MHYSCYWQSSCLSCLRGCNSLSRHFSEDFNSISLDVHQTLHISTLFQVQIRFALVPFRSLLIGESRFCFLFLPVLRCFNSRSSHSHHVTMMRTSCEAILHSEIARSKLACSYLALIAACHVLHRNLNQAIRLIA